MIEILLALHSLFLSLPTVGGPAPQSGVSPAESFDEEVSGWLSWRGPLQNGCSLETGLIDCAEIGGENHLWSLELRGRGTPVIASGRVYSLVYKGDDNDLREGIVCLDQESGEVLWERWWKDFVSDIIYNRYAIGAPTVDPETGNVYVLTTPGILMAMTRDGDPLWEHVFGSEFGRLTFPNGRTGAPAIDDQLVIVNVINAHWGRENGPARTRLYAFDKFTGVNVWGATPGGPPKDSSFCFPVFEWRNGRRLLYGVGGGGYVFCVDARTGQTLWRYRVSAAGMNSFPVIHGDSLIAINGKENIDNSSIGRMLSLPLGAEPESHDSPPVELTADQELWRNPLTAFTSSPVLVGDRIYQTDMFGALNCVDANTGEILWHKKLGADQIHASPVHADGKLYVPMNNGKFWILRPGEDGAEVLCELQLEGNCLGAPAICDGRIYVHTTEKLYCFGDGKSEFVEPPTPRKPIGRERAVRLQVTPADVVLQQGTSVPYRVSAVDRLGNEVASASRMFDWDIPPSIGLRIDDTSARIVAPPDAKPGVGVVRLGVRGSDKGLFGSSRVRVVPALPYAEDLEGVELTRPDPEREGVMLGSPPGFWVGATKKWDVREVDGSKVLAKTLNIPLFQRSTGYFGYPEMSNYTMTVDTMTDGNRRTLSTAGVVNQRYLIQLKGNHQQLEVSSNEWRLKESVPFKIKAGTWYTLTTRVDVANDGSGVVRAKAWERGTPEPGEWTIEVPVDDAHKKGSPGIYSFAPQSRFRVYLDNLSVTPNE